MKRAVFLDRDGTINTDVEYLNSPSQLEIIDGAPNAIKSLNEAGFCVVVVTNQSGIARGLIDEDSIPEIHDAMVRMLGQKGAFIDGFYYCPHHPEGIVEKYRCVCRCRKPEPGLVLRAAADFNIDLCQSYVVGDKVSDIQLAHNAGSIGIMVLTGHGRSEMTSYPETVSRPHKVCRDLSAAASWILSQPDRI